MFEKIKKFFERAWKWIEALWDKHDDLLDDMVRGVLPMVIDVTFRNDLSGDEKRKLIVDTIVENAKDTGEEIAVSMINEAIEIAANKYNIQIGKLTSLDMDAAKEAVLKAAADYAAKKLLLDGKEPGSAATGASDALTNADLDN